jgi:hypothetical protein
MHWRRGNAFATALTLEEAMKRLSRTRPFRLLLNGLAIAVVAVTATGCIVEERPAYYHHGYYHHGYHDGYYRRY